MGQKCCGCLPCCKDKSTDSTEEHGGDGKMRTPKKRRFNLDLTNNDPIMKMVVDDESDLRTDKIEETKRYYMTGFYIDQEMWSQMVPPSDNRE